MNKDDNMFQPTSSTEVTTQIATLLEMLTYKRPAYSETEEAFITKFIRPYYNHPNVTNYQVDDSGNIFFEVNGGGAHLFTCHTDTVHGRFASTKVVPISKGVEQKKAGGRKKKVKPVEEVGPALEKQQVFFDANLMLIYKDDKECLGADDGTGVWLCLEIIEAGIPCWVAMFRSEERGGVGSSNSAKDDPEFYHQFKSALAFDRRGTKDIITYQSSGRCCSDAWAKALAGQLNAGGELSYAPCDGGIFTDTANLTELIPECSNISVGYDHEHSGDEIQDVEHLLKLRDAILKVDWSALPIERDPTVMDYSWSGWDLGGKWSYRSGTHTTTDLYEEGLDFEVESFIHEDDLTDMPLEDMEAIAKRYPEDFALAVFRFIWGREK